MGWIALIAALAFWAIALAFADKASADNDRIVKAVLWAAVGTVCLIASIGFAVARVVFGGGA